MDTKSPVPLPVIEFTAPSINLACVMGRLTAKPVISHTNSGVPMATMLIRTTAWNPRAGCNVTDSHKIVVFGQQLTAIAKVLPTGSTVYIIGKMQTRKYTDAKGIMRLTTEIVAESIQVARLANGNKTQANGFVLAETPMELGTDGRLIDLSRMESFCDGND